MLPEISQKEVRNLCLGKRPDLKDKGNTFSYAKVRYCFDVQIHSQVSTS
jgi:hypothetical protein